MFATLWDPVSYKLVSTLPRLAKKAKTCGLRLAHDDVDLKYWNGIDVVMCKSVKPHTDMYFFGPYTALFIVQTDKHVTCFSDMEFPTDKSHATKGITDWATFIPKVGQMILFNCHHTHWVEKRSDKVFVACSSDYKSPPSREEAEADMIEKLRL